MANNTININKQEKSISEQEMTPVADESRGRKESTASVNTESSLVHPIAKKDLIEFMRSSKRDKKVYHRELIMKILCYAVLILALEEQFYNLLFKSILLKVCFAFVFFVVLVAYFKLKSRIHSVNKYQRHVESIGLAICGILFGFSLLGINILGIDLTFVSLALFTTGVVFEFLFSAINAKSYFSKAFYTFLSGISLYSTLVSLSYMNISGDVLPVLHSEAHSIVSLCCIFLLLLVMACTNEESKFNPYPKRTIKYQFLPSIMLFETTDYKISQKVLQDEVNHKFGKISDTLMGIHTETDPAKQRKLLNLLDRNDIMRSFNSDITNLIYTIEPKNKDNLDSSTDNLNEKEYSLFHKSNESDSNPNISNNNNNNNTDSDSQHVEMTPSFIRRAKIGADV